MGIGVWSGVVGHVGLGACLLVWLKYQSQARLVSYYLRSSSHKNFDKILLIILHKEMSILLFLTLLIYL